MTRDETKQILLVIEASYPNWKPTVDAGFLVNTWHTLLKDYDYKMIGAALKHFIQSDATGFAPSIGQLLDGCVNMCLDYPNETEAWTLVTKALRNSHEPREQFAKLPPIVQKVLGSPTIIAEWGNADRATVHTVLFSQFSKMYRAAIADEKKEISSDPKQLLMLTKFKNEQIEKKADTLITQKSTE